MRALGLSFALCLAPLCAWATPSGADAYFAFARARKLERQVTLVSIDPSLNGLSHRALATALGAELTEARINFYSVLRTDADRLDADEDELLARVASGRPTGENYVSRDRFLYLRETFPDAAKFSPLEWKIFREWYGRENQVAFLRWAFHAETLDQGPGARTARLLVVAPPTDEAAAKLRAAGHTVIGFAPEPHAEPGINEDNLAEAIRGQGGAPVFLVSAGEAGGLVRRTLERHRGLRQHPALAGWLNVNGALFGTPEREGSLERPTPLGDGFPILNLISPRLDGERAALAAEGRTFVIRPGSPWPQLSQALRYVAVPFAAR